MVHGGQLVSIKYVVCIIIDVLKCVSFLGVLGKHKLHDATGYSAPKGVFELRHLHESTSTSD